MTDPELGRDRRDHPALGADEQHASIHGRGISHEGDDITPSNAPPSTNIQQPNVDLGDNPDVDQGTRIRLARTRAKLTQAQLARQLGVRQSAVSQWEKGTVSPELATRIRLAALLDMPLSDVLPVANVSADALRDPEVLQLIESFVELPTEARASIVLMVRSYAERLRRPR